MGRRKSPETHDLSFDTPLIFSQAKVAFELAFIDMILGLAEGNITKAAKLCGKDRKDFYYLLHRNNIKPDDYRVAS